jgi:hypothetical protein
MSQREDALFEVKLDTKMIKETVLPKQPYSDMFKSVGETNWDLVLDYALKGDLKIKKVGVLRTTAPGTAKRIVPSRGNVQAQLRSERRGKQAIVGP